MKIDIRGKQVEIDQTLRDRIERRLEFVLGRFSPRILRVTVRLSDVNGPRGGNDKTCRIEVRLRPTGSLFVEDRDAVLIAVVDRAAERAGRLVARTLQRERNFDRRSQSAEEGVSREAEFMTDAIAAGQEFSGRETR